VLDTPFLAKAAGVVASPFRLERIIIGAGVWPHEIGVGLGAPADGSPLKSIVTPKRAVVWGQRFDRKSGGPVPQDAHQNSKTLDTQLQDGRNKNFGAARYGYGGRTDANA